MSKTTPTQRTLAYLREQGATVEVVERWNAHARVKQDLFGFADLVALDGTITAVQCTTGSNHAARRHKILHSFDAWRWLRSGGRVLLISWRKRTKEGWTPRLDWITAADFATPRLAEWGEVGEYVRLEPLKQQAATAAGGRDE